MKLEAEEEAITDIANYFNHHVSQVKEIYLKLGCNIINLVKVEVAMKDLHFVANPNTQEELNFLLNHKADGWFSKKDGNNPLEKKILIHILKSYNKKQKQKLPML